MRDEYDFSESRPNPYAGKMQRSVTLRLDSSVVDYFEALAVETSIPFQKLINLYLKDCAESGRKLKLDWGA